MPIYKGRQVQTATAAATATAATSADPVIDRYVERMNNILSQLLTTNKKEVAISRLDILKQEVAIMKKQMS